MRLETDLKLDFSDVLLKPKRSTLSSRSQVELTRVFRFKHSERVWAGIPIISANMTSVTNVEVLKVMAEHLMLAAFPKHSGKQYDVSCCPLQAVIHTIGLDDNPELILNMLCVDVANGYMEKFVQKISQLRSQWPHVTIIAGNVVTAEMTEALILAGADVVKVGIGSGSACSTRLKTGVGYPQLSAIAECADAAHGLGAHIISDGGCTTPGDVAKAFAAGADFVMLGGMLAGCQENGPNFYGMSSRRANEEMAGGLKDYKAAEGWEMELPPKGPLKDVLQDIKGGLRSACAYVGAKRLKDLPKCATFIRVNNQINRSLLDYRV
jgi:GMP reductase